MSVLELSDVLTFKPSLNVHRIQEDSVLIASTRERSVISAKHCGHVIELIDGSRTVEDILQCLSEQMPGAYALSLLQQLASKGLLVAATPDGPSGASMYWDDAGFHGADAVDTLRARSVAVQSVGGSAELVDEMRRALEASNLNVDPDARFCVVVTKDYLEPALSEFNARARAHGRSWCIASPVGTQPMVGPWFDPNGGPCWECLAFWLRVNRPIDELLARQSRGLPSARSTLTAGTRNSIATACGLGGEAIARALLLGAQETLNAKLWAFDFNSLQATRHAVRRRPQCARCGDGTRVAVSGRRPIELSAVSKRFSMDGGYRQHPPTETFERLRHLVGPIVGAVTYLTSVPSEPDPLRPVFASSYLVCPRQDPARRHAFDKPCAGKGRTLEQARTSALCEALERFSGVYQGDEARIRASRSELGPSALSPEELQNFSDTQYSARDAQRVSPSDVRRWVPKRLGANEAIDWSPAWSLTYNERRYVPLAYCYAEAPGECGTEFTGPCGNGVAAGTCIEEAILQGLLELVERDAAAVWWYNRLSRPGIDFASFNDPWFDALRRSYEERGVDLWLLDITHDLGICCCVAIGYHVESGRLYLGFGCHLSGRLAVQRAVTELNQIFVLGDLGRLAPFQLSNLAESPYLRPHPTQPRRTAAELAHADNPDLLRDIRLCIARLEDAGLDVSVVNKTRPDIELNVAQVVVPGLRHFWPRFGPGRLYQVPQRMGWVDQPLNESQLNPLPLFL